MLFAVSCSRSVVSRSVCRGQLSWTLNLPLVRSHQTEIIIVKRLIQGRNNVTRMGVKPGSCGQGRCTNDAFALGHAADKLDFCFAFFFLLILAKLWFFIAEFGTEIRCYYSSMEFLQFTHILPTDLERCSFLNLNAFPANSVFGKNRTWFCIY